MSTSVSNSAYFRTPPVQNQPSKPVSNSVQQKEPDTKISKTAIGIGVGAVLVGGIIMAGMIAKGNFSGAKRLAEQIDFKKATTMDEAVKFAKETLGVNLQIGDNVEVANFVNEIFVNVSNKMKGKARLPKKVSFKSACASDGIEAFASYSTSGHLKLGSSFQKLVNVAKQKGLSFDEFLVYFKNKASKDKEFVKRAIYHELGHANHSDFMKMRRLSELKASGYKDTHLTDEFLQAINNNKIVKDFFEQNTVVRLDDGTIYALSSPAEFVAETFSLKMLGTPISKDVEKIYQKYGGPMLA